MLHYRRFQRPSRRSAAVRGRRTRTTPKASCPSSSTSSSSQVGGYSTVLRVLNRTPGTQPCSGYSTVLQVLNRTPGAQACSAVLEHALGCSVVLRGTQGALCVGLAKKPPDLSRHQSSSPVRACVPLWRACAGAVWAYPRRRCLSVCLIALLGAALSCVEARRCRPLR
jgi:hypothetical protein